MQKPDPAKAEAIVAAAQKRFAHYGVQKTTMRDIAQDVGIAVATLYVYFKNKDEILIAVAKTYEQQHFVDTEVILNSKAPPCQKLKTYLVNRFRVVKENRLSGSHAAELARTVLKVNPQLQAEQGQQVKNNVLTILQEGIKKNVFHIENLEVTLEVFLYSISCFFPLPTTEKYYEPEEEKLCMVIDWFIQQWS